MLTSHSGTRDSLQLADQRDPTLRLLHRHQERRQQGVPTLTVIAGPPHVCCTIVRCCAGADQAANTENCGSKPADATARWFACLTSAHDLVVKSYEWMAARASSEPRNLSFGLRFRSPDEQALFLDRAVGTSNSPIATVCRAIVEHDCQRGSDSTSLWDRLLQAFKGDRQSLIAALVILVGDGRLPVYCIHADAVDLSRLRLLIDELTSLAFAAPTLPVVLSLDNDVLDRYLANAHESRSLALMREGLIRLDDDRAAQGLAIRGTAGDECRGTDFTTLDVVSPPESQDGARSTARISAAQVDSPERDDPARSAAERYLFERLQSHPQTAGLFELNGLLTCAPSERPLEVDLLARGPKVAVEIDGYYHFTEPDAYRRDRRKDVLLQHAGYLVVRCLADDVASRLEEILETIVTAVRHRAAGQGRAGELPLPYS